MGEGTLEIGQQDANFRDRQQDALGKQPGLVDKVKKNKGILSSIASLATSLGILGGTLAGHNTTGPIVDTATGTKDVAVDFAQGAKDRVNALNNTTRYGSAIKPTEAPKPTSTAPIEVKK